MPDGSVHKKILFIAIPTERVNDYKLIAEDSGFKVINTELESISTARALTLNSQEPTLIIDMGGRSSTCTVAKNGKAYAITQTDFSSDSATQAVAQALSISPKRAEALKRQSAVHLDAGTHELSTIVTPIIGAILTEAERAQKTFEEATGEKIAKVVLCGAGSQLSGIEKYAETQLKLPVTKAGAIGTLISYPPELLAILPELNAHLTVALGLALKKLI
jgi:Tfp pilus assembly PilM family ATPase